MTANRQHPLFVASLIRGVVFFLVSAASVWPAAKALAAEPTFTQFALTTSGVSGPHLAAGADGAVWFTEQSYTGIIDGCAGYIGRMTLGGQVSDLFVTTIIPPGDYDPCIPSGASAITAGPDGALWFADNNRIGRITTSGSFSSFHLPIPTVVADMTTGADGNLWFTDYITDSIGRLTTSGTVTQFPLPTANSDPTAIIAGPDGALWFTEKAAGKIGRITTSGVVSEYTLPTSDSGPAGITVGPDGAMWFSAGGGFSSLGAIGRITTEGTITEYFPFTSSSSQPGTMVAGTDGNLWFLDGSDRIGRITPAGTVSEFPLPAGVYGTVDLAVAADGAVWITVGSTQANGASILRMVPPPAALSLKLTSGWNLVGNSVDAALDVAATFGDAAKITTVWKWNRAAGRWAFYAPSMTPSALAAYAQGKGYDLLGSIEPKEGFWVNAVATVAVTGPEAKGVSLLASDLLFGWNLVASDDHKTPAQLRQALSDSLNAEGKEMVTAWAWDAAKSSWKFFAPAMAAQGGTVLSDYIAGKGFLPFDTALSASDGFWLHIGVAPPATVAASITADPAVQTVIAGQEATFTVAVGGQPPPAIHWQLSTDAGVSWDDLMDDGNHVGVETATLTITATTIAQNGNLYRAVASNSAGAAPSSGALLTVTQAAFSVLHHFDLFSQGGNPPVSEALIASGETLYGVAYGGGANGNGVLFSVNNDGTAYSVIHGFSALASDGTNADGALPYGTLKLVGNTLYGTASAGGTLGNGVLFALNPDGTNFTTLSNFSGAPLNSSYGKHSPVGELVLSAATLYGITARGGAPEYDGSVNGRIFAANLDGSVTFPYAFPASTWDGDHLYSPYGPYGGLMLQDNRLYGITISGGYDDYGTVFAVNSDGSGYTTLHNFMNTDGATPFALLALAGDTLYGTTDSGGSQGHGVIFSIHCDGSGFSVLHTFSDPEGFGSQAGLLVSGDTLYGTTLYGGSKGYGTIFSLKTDGSAYTILHSLDRYPDGAAPSRLLLVGTTLYGMAANGGSFDKGTIFRLALAQ